MGKAAQSPPAAFRLVRPEEIHPLLRMILGANGHPADDSQLLDFLAFAQHRSIDLEELWVVESGKAMIWGMLPICSPGRTTLMLLPTDPPKGPVVSVLPGMIEAICDRFTQRNVQLAQVLLEPSDEICRPIFEKQGFTRMAELIYLHAAIRRPLPLTKLPQQYSATHYSSATHALFASAILTSYQQSLDCPGLNGVRNIEDIIAGHKASGEFDPNHWLVLCEQDTITSAQKPVGVLLLCRLPRGEAAELVYLGLAPEARGQGLSEWMMRQAFAISHSMGVARLSLAVDSINAPALKLYYRFGMSRLASKIALMRPLIP